MIGQTSRYVPVGKETEAKASVAVFLDFLDDNGFIAFSFE